MPTPIEQLLSRTVYDTDGTTTVWDFSFASGYLDPSHVKAYTTDAAGLRTDITVTVPMLIGEFQLQITPALADNLVLTVYRDTPKDAPLVNFTDESGFSEIALDTNAKQAVMVAAEAIDTVNSSDINGAIEAALDATAAAASAAASAASIVGDAAIAEAAADAAEAFAASINPASFATAAQGTKADSALQIASLTGAATKTPPVDADEFTFLDSAAGSIIKKFTWANLKAALVTALSTTFALRGTNSDITSLSGLAARGLRFLSGGSIDLASSMPSSGSYVAGDFALELTTSARVSGWKRLTTGSGHVLNTDWLYFTNITSGTAVATTSGTSIDFTGIPAGVKRITGMPVGVSTSGTSTVMIQIGDSGGIENTGYLGGHMQASSGAAASLTGLTTGFALGVPTAATMALRGVFTLYLQDATTNTWVYGAATSDSTNDRDWSCSGSKSLSATLDRIRLTALNGTDTFDAGSINILWEF